MTEQDLHYLKSILGNLREFRTSASVRKVGLTIGTEILSDNIDWLDCFIDRAMKGDRPRRGFSSPGFEQGMQSEWDAQLAKAVTAEREACAQVADNWMSQGGSPQIGKLIAAAIRAKNSGEAHER